MKKYKRVFSALLALLMCVSLFPLSAFADKEAADITDDAVESVYPVVHEEVLLPEAEEASTEPAVVGVATLPAEEEASTEPVAVGDASLPAGEEASTESVAVGDASLPAGEEASTEFVEPAEDKILLQNIAEAENDVVASGTSGLKLIDAAGFLGNSWSDEVASYWNSYVPAKPGDVISLWVEVSGFSNTANVTYKWERDFLNEDGIMTGEDTGERGARFPDFTMGEQDCRYQCRISDGEGGNIYVAFDVMIDTSEPEPPGQSYKVTIAPNIRYGEVKADKISAVRDDTVTLTVIPAEGYALAENSLTVTYTDNNKEQKSVALSHNSEDDVYTWTFTMPAYPVVVSAVFASLRTITVANVPGGTISVDKTEALAGEFVTMTVSAPERNYEFLYVIYRDDESGSEHKLTPDIADVYSFEMPDHNVTVSAVFAPLVTYAGIVFRPWGRHSGYPDGGAAGNWYLIEDVDMGEAAWEISSNVNLFLNGHALRGDVDGPLIKVGGNLTLYDQDDNSGSITNRANFGCGVFTNSGNSSFIMNGGTITGCRDGNSYGSGVGVFSGSFTMNGGVIRGNSGAGGGAGVAVNSYASFSMNGGEIPGNSNVGVYIMKDATFEISGAPEISGNKSGNNDNNVFLEDGAVIKITGTLTNTIPIGVTTRTAPDTGIPVIITSGLRGKGTAANFTSDTSEVVAELNTDQECMLAIPPKSIVLDRDYLLIKQGMPASLKVIGLSDEWLPKVEWSWEPADENNAEVLIDVQDGTLKANRAGTAYMIATLPVAGTKLSARCRIDVLSSEAEAAVSEVLLTDSKATVELYQTTYTQIQVVPKLTQNYVTAQAVTPVIDNVELPHDVGVAITGAFFEEDSNNAGINDLFSLRVANDRTLEIIPTDLAREYGVTNNKTLKSGYKAPIIVTVNGENFTAGTLTLRVKKTLPKISVKPVKFNSFLTTDVKVLDFGGMETDSIEIDGTKTNPPWIALGDNGSVTYNGTVNGKISGKLNLLVRPKGWSVKVPVAVSVSAASTAPKMTLKPASVSLQPNGKDTVTAAVTITPMVFVNNNLCRIIVTSYRDGNNVYDLMHQETWPIHVAINPAGSITVYPGKAMPTDGKAHTYKITLGLTYNGSISDTAVLTVKLPARKAPALTLKATGTIDLAVPDSPVTFVPTLKNVGGTVTYAVTKITDIKGNDSTELFKADGLMLTAADGLEQGKYFATITARYGKNESVSKKIAFTVKESKSATATVTLKATGNIDVLRPGSAVTLKPTVKNLYGYTLRDTDVTIQKTYDGATKQKVSMVVTDSFEVKVKDGKYIITKKDAVSHLDKFTVAATVGGVAAKAVKLSVKMGSAKVTQSTKAVTLLKTDRYSSAPVILTLTDPSLGEIREVKLVSPADKAGREYFSLEWKGQGEYEIRFNENLLPPDIATLKSQTVKLQVFLKGNETPTKPNATLSVKVNTL